MSKKKVFILSNFQQYLRAYSPIVVVQAQIEMLLRNGYEPVLITNKGWNPPEDSIFMQIENRQLTPVVIDGTVVDEAFERDVETLYKELKEIIGDEGVVLTHDLIFLPDYVKHNVACRKLAKENDSVRWLHWVHSATAPGLLIQERAMFGEKYAQHLNEKFPNSVICYPNSYDIPRVARNFNYEEDEIVEVPHATNPVEDMDRLVVRLYDELRLGEKEVLMIYPLRLDRGKQPDMNVRLINACREEGMTAHLIFCDFHSTGGDKVTYREELKALAEKLGCANNVTFLSEFDESASLEVPHRIILQLLTLSNVFLMPSKSETYSLVAQEAMLKGNLVILNHDFSPFRQIYGKNAIYKPFSSNIGFDGYDGEIKTEYADVDAWFRERAVNLRYWLENDKTLRAKTWVRVYRNPDYVFKMFIEPILTRENEGGSEDAEVLGDNPGVLGTGTDTGGGILETALSREDGPAGN